MAAGRKGWEVRFSSFYNPAALPMLRESTPNSCFSSTPLSQALFQLFLTATRCGGALSCHYYPCNTEKETLWEWRNLLKVNTSASCGTRSQIHILWLRVHSWQWKWQKPRSCMAVCRNEFCLWSKTVDPWKKNEFSVGFAGRENRA